MITTATILTLTELQGIRRILVNAGVVVTGDLTATLIAGGRSNLTFLLDDGTSQWVLRTPPRAGRTASAHDVAREWRVTHALNPTEVPVATAVALHEDADLLGGPVAIWEFIHGTSVQTQSDLEALPADQITQLTDVLLSALACLHRVDPLAIGLEGLGRPTGYAARQLRRWSSQWQTASEDPAAFDQSIRADVAELHRRLAENIPDQARASIVHGDFRIDNTILDVTRTTPRVAAIIDWELSTIGDPVADVAMTAAYRHPAFDLILGRPTAATSSLMPDASTIAAAYERNGGLPLNDWEFHLALAYYKIAMIAAGIDHRHRAGGTVGAGFDTAGESVPFFIHAGFTSLGPGVR